MNLKIETQKENILLDRKELVVRIGTTGVTPKRQDVLDRLSATLNVDKNLVVVDQILQKFGTHECKAHVRVYNNADSLKRIEPPVKEKKEKPKEAEAAPQAAAPAPAKAEEKK